MTYDVQVQTQSLGYMGGVCGDSCAKAGADLAMASVPLLGIVAGATALYGIAKYCFGRVDISLEGQRRAQDLHARDMRAHRQEASSVTQNVSMVTISSAALIMVLAVIKAMPVLGVLGGLVLISAIGGGAVMLTHVVHDRLAGHDGRPVQA